MAKPGDSGFRLFEELHNYENRLIREALLMSEGRVSKAAGLLGISHQALCHILKARQAELSEFRTPLGHRHYRRIIKKGKARKTKKTSG